MRNTIFRPASGADGHGQTQIGHGDAGPPVPERTVDQLQQGGVPEGQGLQAGAQDGVIVPVNQAFGKQFIQGHGEGPGESGQIRVVNAADGNLGHVTQRPALFHAGRLERQPLGGKGTGGGESVVDPLNAGLHAAVVGFLDGRDGVFRAALRDELVHGAGERGVGDDEPADGDGCSYGHDLLLYGMVDHDSCVSVTRG
ncbi:MAG: hypothetical protein EBU90_30515 [Proteobacteria bacterium]|nr:hypothetical protein [Pseudomonadota bacterium]